MDNEPSKMGLSGKCLNVNMTRADVIGMDPNTAVGCEVYAVEVSSDDQTIVDECNLQARANALGTVRFSGQCALGVYRCVMPRRFVYAPPSN